MGPYDYDRRYAARPRKAPKSRGQQMLVKAVEQSFLELSPSLRQGERTAPQQAAKSFAEEAASQFVWVIGNLAEKWSNRIIEGQTKSSPRAKVLSTDSVQDGYLYEEGRSERDTETYYSCEAEFPDAVEMTYRVNFTPMSIIKEALDDFAPYVELEDDRDIARVLIGPGVQRALQGLFAEVAPEANIGGGQFSTLAKRAMDIAYEKADIVNDSDDPDETEIGVPGKLHLMVEEPTWKLSTEGFTMVFSIVYRLRGRILWPGDRLYGDYM